MTIDPESSLKPGDGASQPLLDGPWAGVWFKLSETNDHHDETVSLISSLFVQLVELQAHLDKLNRLMAGLE